VQEIKNMDCFLLHGWGVTNLIWEKFSPNFNLFKNIYTPCLYGPIVKSEGTSLESISEALSKIIKNDSILVAWSISGLIALKLLGMSSKIKAVVFIASTPCFINKHRWHNVIDTKDLEELKKKFANNTRSSLNHFASLVAHGDTQASKTNKAVRRYLAHERNKNSLSSWLNELETTDFRKILAFINIPCFFIFGENDILIKSRINKQVECLMPEAKCTTIKNCGHAPFISQPEVTYKLISEFLNERI
tara:strand:+ start:1031 stop:1771 length:741 start_codon:yes stop_codon:yes gene_type:complete